MNSNSVSMSWLRAAFVALVVSLTASTVMAQAAVRRAPQVTAIKAGHIVTGEGPVLKNAVLLIQGRKIIEVGANVKIPKGARVIDMKDAWLAPGMIDVMSQASMPNDRKEPRDAIDLSNRPATAAVAGHRDFKLLAKEGITTVVVLPTPDGVVSGIGAVMKTNGRAREAVQNGPVAMALTASTRKTKRYPTSLMGAFQLLGQTLSKPGDNEVLKAVAGNKRASMIRVETEPEIRAYFRLAELLGVKFGMVTDGSLRLAMDKMPKASMVALPAPSLKTTRRDLLLPAELHKRKHLVTFYAATPTRNAADLRYGAALAVRMGLASGHGLASVTSNPAAMAGIDSQVGTLKKGKDADFLVLSGHLLDLGAELKQTWINGRMAYKKTDNEESK